MLRSFAAVLVMAQKAGGLTAASLTLHVQSNPDIEESSYSPNLGPPLHTLVIVARGVYNHGTTVQCAVLSFTSATEYSSIAVLLIQGIVTLL